MYEHIKQHHIRYASFLLVAFLVSAVVYTLYRARAETIPTFVKNVQPIASGHTLVNTTATSIYGIGSDSSNNMYAATPVGLLKIDQAGNVQSIGSGAYTVRVDSSNNIYYTTFTSIRKADTSGNILASFGSFGSGAGQFNQAGDIAVDTSGNVYIADQYNYRVDKFDSSGNFVLSFGSSGTGDGQFNIPQKIDTDASGNVYVIDAMNRLQKFDSSGNFVALMTSSYYICPTNIRFDSAGNYYVIDPCGPHIVKLDSGGNLLGEITANALGAPFSNLNSISVDSSGNVYIGDGITAGISKYDSSLSPVAFYGPSGGGTGEYRHPLGSAVDSSGNVYTIDDKLNRIVKTDPNGNYLLSIGAASGGDPSGLASSWGIAIDASNHIYATDAYGSVKEYDTSGNFIKAIGSSGSGDGQFQYPYYVAVDSAGNVYVTDQTLANVQKFDSSGNFVLKFGSAGSGNGQFGSYSGPSGITVDSLGNIYVADADNNRIQKFDSSGNYLSQFGDPSGPGQPLYPQGIAVDASGNLYVADEGPGGVSVFGPDGTYKYLISGVGDASFVTPSDVKFVDSTGKIYVTDAKNRRVAVWQGTASGVTLAISEVNATSTAASTIFSFTTDQNGSTQIEYGPTTAYGSITAETDTSPRVISHSIALTDLPQCAVLNYRVHSKSSTNTETISPNYTVTTDECTGSASPTATSTAIASTVSTTTLTVSTVTISVPPDFDDTSSATTTFQAIKLDPAPFFASSSVPDGMKSAGTDVYHLTALVDATTTVTSFTAPITVTLSYDPDAVASLIPSTLTIYRYDSATWNPLSNCSRDLIGHTVACETTHFSDFALFGQPNTSSVTMGASGYRQPDGSLSTTPPAGGGGSSSVPAPQTQVQATAQAPTQASANTTATTTKPAKPLAVIPKTVDTVKPATTTKPVTATPRKDSFAGAGTKETSTAPTRVATTTPSQPIPVAAAQPAAPNSVPATVPATRTAQAQVAPSFFAKWIQTFKCWFEKCAQ